MNQWHARNTTPAAPGLYLTAEVEVQEIGPNGLRRVIYHDRDMRRWNGEKWSAEHDEFSHWYGEANDGAKQV